MEQDTFLDELRGKEQIRDAMARYSRGIDRRDEELVRSAYHSDSTDEHGYGFVGTGWDLAAMVRRDGNGFPDEWKSTTHFLGQHLIDVRGETAVSEVYFIAYTRTEDADGVDWDHVVTGRYLDRWERRGGDFRIAYRTVAYDWMRADPARTIWPGPDHDVPKMHHGGTALSAAHTTFGVAGPADPSYELLGLPAPTAA